MNRFLLKEDCTNIKAVKIPFDDAELFKAAVITTIAYRSKLNQPLPHQRETVLSLFCSGCNFSLNENALFSHLRKKHGMRRGGKKKQRALAAACVEPVRSDFGLIQFIVNPLFLREILVRLLQKSLTTFTATLNAFNGEEIPIRFIYGDFDENTLSFKIEIGMFLYY